MKSRRLDHIDLRVKDMKKAEDFYGKILPAVGFTCDRSNGEEGTFYSVGGDRPSDFFGINADPNHRPNGTRIAFWAETRAEVDEFARIALAAGAKNPEGPEVCQEYSPGYYAFFFEDPDGNKLEICCRENPVIKE